eukprot:g3537.t1
MPRCREVRFVELIWEPRPADDHEPCLAWSEVGGLMSSGSESAQPVAGEYLNGGFYGGRAADLEVALRKLLHLQGRLPEVNARGEAYQNHGKTHQYLWNQYLIEHPEQVTLDYGGAFVVNLARRSISPRQFGKDEMGSIKSPPNGTHEFEGRNRFDTQVFQMDLRSGDCLAWRCFQRCDLTFAELETQAFGESPPSQRLGTWSGLGKDLVVGARIALTTWLPRRYAIGIRALQAFATDMWTVGTIMYILLCGYPPFFGDSDAEILSRVRSGNFSFNDADWRHISDMAKDLIRGLLRMSEIERVSAKQALFDQWIIQTAPVLRAPLKQKYFENMRKYVGFNKFKQATLQIIVSQLEPEIAKPLIDTFMWIDSSGEGHIDAAEIEAGMKRAGWTEIEIPEDLEEMVNSLDADGSGEIGLGEFVASILDLQVYAREETCWAVFRIYDQDGDGLIGNTDVYNILNNGQPEEAISAHECRELIKEADEERCNGISFAEFLNMMKGVSGNKKEKKKGSGQEFDIQIDMMDDLANINTEHEAENAFNSTEDENPLSQAAERLSQDAALSLQELPHLEAVEEAMAKVEHTTPAEDVLPAEDAVPKADIPPAEEVAPADDIAPVEDVEGVADMAPEDVAQVDDVAPMQGNTVEEEVAPTSESEHLLR